MEETSSFVPKSFCKGPNIELLGANILGTFGDALRKERKSTQKSLLLFFLICVLYAVLVFVFQIDLQVGRLLDPLLSDDDDEMGV